MKRIFCILTVLLMLLALAGCGNEPEATEPSVPGETDPAAMTEEELLKLFDTHAEEGWQVIDCVVFDESCCGIGGAVQYTQPDYDGTMFAFFKDDQPLTTGVEAVPVHSNIRLRYAGDDRVVCRLKNESGEFTCSVTCTVSGDGVNFTIVAPEAD